MAKENTFRCVVQTPDGEIVDEVCTGVNLPALDGYMGILPGRSPVTAVLYTGTLTIQAVKGGKTEMFVSRGFLRMAGQTCTILAEECMPVGDLDPEVAWNLLQKAYKMPQETREQRDLRDEVIHAGRIRFSMAQKARKGMMSMEQMLSRGLS